MPTRPDTAPPDFRTAEGPARRRRSRARIGPAQAAGFRVGAASFPSSYRPGREGRSDYRRVRASPSGPSPPGREGEQVPPRPPGRWHTATGGRLRDCRRGVALASPLSPAPGASASRGWSASAPLRQPAARSASALRRGERSARPPKRTAPPAASDHERSSPIPSTVVRGSCIEQLQLGRALPCRRPDAKEGTNIAPISLPVGEAKMLTDWIAYRLRPTPATGGRSGAWTMSCAIGSARASARSSARSMQRIALGQSAARQWCPLPEDATAHGRAERGCGPPARAGNRAR